ncbi:hypothetical protein D3C87_956680 [compost metagenome]|jgi:hypothetical protein|uniref:DUF2946 domain-containing protein n=1 Tax=Aeromonas media TaxID=651 RepID=A0A6M4YBD9_AERME|nr:MULTISPECIES: hypothetical protein [Aeromonas]MBP8282266.1 hypothetical protein [Aeromonas sp.]AVP93617.1 hypothetical protein C7N77_10685 [Aeromonas rivipollensis]MCE9925757.1 hypothetical protein [Aeromonas media]MCE9955947.1 hypothetical protein [Aeromonas rivipollensis]QJT22644.1 hypothetical protein E4184_15320 [Aeromonas media]
MLSSRLPTVLIARLLLGLLLVCNLTLCISWHGAAAREEATSPSLAMTSAANLPAAMQGLPCHDGGDGYAAADLNQDECQMHGGLTSPMGAGLPLLAALLTLLALPLLLLPPGTVSQQLENWLRDPFLRSRGTHPPSWPRRHLMLSVLRH